MSDLTYKGTSALSQGVRIESIKRPLLANMRQQHEEIAGRHGSYSFTDGTLEDTVIEVACWLSADSRMDLRSRARQLAFWLYSKEKQRLMFDDEPGVFYLARLANQIDMETLIRHGRFTLQFRCDPFAYALQEQVDRQFITASSQFVIQVEGTGSTQPVIAVKNNGGSALSGFTLTVENEVEE
ncbi:distal tail protein Dit [Aneurinibacillus sp. REN35]|uniref:distal tail protein Dit n=1 Tax=Aneurinibacillus sp. REN35 TaxID=3237286 RepID=UPI003529A20E